MDKKKVCCLISFIIVLLSLTGCSPAQNYSRVAGINPEFQISVKDDGTINLQGKPDEMYDFSSWKDIISVSSGIFNVAGIKKDGTVLVTGNKEWGACNVDGWRDIVMVEFIATATFGLTSDGHVIYTESVGHILKEDTIKSEVDSWKDIAMIDASQLIVAGVKANGEAVVSAPYAPELEKQVAEWENVKSVSVSSSRIAGLTYDGEILLATAEAPKGISDEALERYNELKDAKEICTDEAFVAGLMPDGTLIIRFVLNDEQELPDDFKALDGQTNVVDINSYEDELFVLKEDGTILYAGFTE